MSSRLSIITIWVCFALLLSLGAVMVSSTSTVLPGESPFHLLRNHCMFSLLGLLLAFILAHIEYRTWRRFIPLIWGGCVLLLIFCFVPGIGKTINGESRWIHVFYTFQPSELAKISLMLCLAHWYTIHKEKRKSIVMGFLIPGLIFGIPLMLIFFEKDMGTAAALGMAGFCLMFAAGARWWILLLSLLLGALLMYHFTTDSANRMARIEAWEDPEAYREGAGAQQYISQVAFDKGDTTGVGLGEASEKYGRLPYAHTDFIYAIIGEELGVVGSGAVLALFTIMAAAGVCLSVQTQERFGQLLSLGLISTIFLPAMLNMMVVTSLLPNSGLPLPFISYGGTNLIFTIAAIGLLTSIQRHSPSITINYWPRRRHSRDFNP